jgi:hypothetical protein
VKVAFSCPSRLLPDSVFLTACCSLLLALGGGRCERSAGCGGVVGLGFFQHAGREVPEGGSLVGAQGLEQVLFDVLLSLGCTFERLTSRTREVYSVPTAVCGITAADDVAEIFEFVEQYHHVAGVHAEHIVEFLLGSAVAIGEIAERE